MKINQKIFTCLYMAAFVMFFSSINIYGQYKDPQAAEVLETVWQHYEQSIRDVDDYKIVTEQFTTHYVKQYENGRPYFVSQVETDSFWGSISGLGMHTTSPMVDADFFSSEVFDHLKQNAVYLGMESLDGMNTHIIFLEDMRVFMDTFDDVDEPMGQLRLYFDDEHWVLRQMKFSAEAEIEEGRVQVIEPVVKMTDYRNISGMMVPFETRISVQGLTEHLSDAEREEAQLALMEFERELAQMPEEQRQMLEKMMSGQLDQLRKVLEDDSIEFLINVKEVIVNTGQ
jgi:hypothetical protein